MTMPPLPCEMPKKANYVIRLILMKKKDNYTKADRQEKKNKDKGTGFKTVERKWLTKTKAKTKIRQQKDRKTYN